jgi:fumarylpyruvate hydrolase
MAHTTCLWAPPPLASLPVRGRSERLPVNRIFCVGRNCQAHAVAMGCIVLIAAVPALSTWLPKLTLG